MSTVRASWLKRREIGAEIVHFSTQYAFAGEPLGRAPYTITMSRAPVNVYGKTKLVGEEAVRGGLRAQLHHAHVLGLWQRQKQFSLHRAQRSQNRQKSARHR